MKNRTYTFTFSLTFIFAMLLLLSFSAIIIYNYIKTSSDLYELSKNINTEIRQSVVDRSVSGLEKIAAHLRVLSKTDESKDIMLNADNSLKIMWEQLLSDENIASIFIADEHSNFIQARRKPQFATRVIKKVDDVRMDIWEYKDKDDTTQAIEAYISTYDPVTRDWYKKADTKQTFYWSDPYIFSSTGKSGITIAYPYINEYGEKVKVAAADITLDSLSTFLEKQKSVVGGDLILFNEKSEIIATSLMSHLEKGSDGKIITLKDLPKTLFGNFEKAYKTNPHNGELISANNKEYIYAVSEFPKEFSKKWYLATFSEKDKLLGSIRDTVNNMLIMSLVIMIFFLAIILYISKKISRPIQKLSDEMNQLKDMNLDIEIIDNSMIKEIKVAQNSMILLKSGLESFKKYMPSELVKILIQTGQQAKIGGSQKNLAVMFTDIEGFTTISESMSPEDLMIHLSDYFQELVSIIGANSGTVDKYIGDAIMAFWGAPLDIEDPCLVAVNTAIEMQKKLDEMNEKWAREGKPKLKTRIGIHYGATLVGNVGSHDRLNYTIIGDSVNIASRLEGINKDYGTNIMISDVVNDILDGKVKTRYVDSILLKGKTENTKMYTIDLF